MTLTNTILTILLLLFYCFSSCIITIFKKKFFKRKHNNINQLCTVKEAINTLFRWQGGIDKQNEQNGILRVFLRMFSMINVLRAMVQGVLYFLVSPSIYLISSLCTVRISNSQYYTKMQYTEFRQKILSLQIYHYAFFLLSKRNAWNNNQWYIYSRKCCLSYQTDGRTHRQTNRLTQIIIYVDTLLSLYYLLHCSVAYFPFVKKND